MAVPAATPRVLVADDDPQLLRLIERLLARGGFAVASAGDGAEALRRFREEAGSIGVVVLDAAIAPAGAAPLLSEMARLEPGLSVVFTSGDALSREQRELLARHGGVFLRKPFAPAALLRAVLDSKLREGD